MAAEYMHIGVPVLGKREGTVCNEDMRFWVSNMDDYNFEIEYLKFEEGAPFPEILSEQPHVAYRMDDLDHCASQAQRIIFGPADCGPDVGLAFIIWDGAVVELYEKK